MGSHCTVPNRPLRGLHLALLAHFPPLESCSPNGVVCLVNPKQQGRSAERREGALREVICPETTYLFSSLFWWQWRFPWRFYIIAILFVVFDVETIFLFPWAVQYKALHIFGLVEMLVFLGILIVGYIWIWKKGALEWI